MLVAALLLLIGFFAAALSGAAQGHGPAAMPVASSTSGRASARASKPLSAAAEAELKTALDLYDQGDLAGAEPRLIELTRRYPSSFEAAEALGSLYLERNDLEHALGSLRHASALAPSEPIAQANLGAAYLKAGRMREAIAELRLAARSDPKNASTESNLGQALMAAREPAAAIPAFTIASQLNPTNAALRYNLALALFQTGALEAASSALKAIPREAASADVDSLAGDIAERRGDFREAIVYLQSAAQKDPSDANLYALTLELLRHWTWDEALKIASFAVARYPASTHFVVAEGIARYGAAQYPEAAKIFSGLLAAAPDQALYADLLGRSCSQLAEDTSADCKGLLAFAQRHPANATASTYAATSLLHRPAAEQEPAVAATLLKQAIAADPNLPEAYFQLAVLDQIQLQWKESATLLEKAIDLRPAYPEAHYRLSRAYVHLGMKAEAEQQIALQQKFMQQEKDNMNAHLQEVVTFLLKAN